MLSIPSGRNEIPGKADEGVRRGGLICLKLVIRHQSSGQPKFRPSSSGTFCASVRASSGMLALSNPFSCGRCEWRYEVVSVSCVARGPDENLDHLRKSRERGTNVAVGIDRRSCRSQPGTILAEFTASTHLHGNQITHRCPSRSSGGTEWVSREGVFIGGAEWEKADHDKGESSEKVEARIKDLSRTLKRDVKIL